MDALLLVLGMLAAAALLAELLSTIVMLALAVVAIRLFA